MFLIMVIKYKDLNVKPMSIITSFRTYAEIFVIIYHKELVMKDATLFANINSKIILCSVPQRKRTRLQRNPID